MNRRARAGCLVVVFLTLAIGPLRAEPEPTALAGEAGLASIRFRPDWFPNAQFSGFFWAQVDGLYAEAGLDVAFDEFAFGSDFLGAVASGEAAFGTAEAYILIDAIAAGAPLVAIGAVLAESPAGYIYLADGAIDGPADLRGRRVGVHNYADRLLPFFATRAGLAPQEVDGVIVQHDMQILLDGKVDLHQGYATDEMLRLAAMTDRPVDILLFERMGLPMYSMVIYTSRDTLERYPERVDAFLAASAEGWTRAMRSPRVAASVVNHEFPSDAVDDAMVARQAEALAPFVIPEEGPVLSMSRAKWAAMQAALLDSGLIERPVDLDAVLYRARP